MITDDADPQVQYPDHTELWERYADTDTVYVKKIEGGRYGAAGLSNIDPTYQFQRATEEWGPMGHAWGLREIRYEIVRDSSNAPVCAIMQGTFFAPGIEIEQIHNCRWDAKADMLMGMRTHLIKKALANLGFSHAIHMGEFDDATYMSRGEDVTADVLVANIVESFNETKDVDTLTKYYNLATTKGLKSFHMAQVGREYDRRKRELASTESEGVF